MSASNAQPFPLLTLHRYEKDIYSGFKVMCQLKNVAGLCEFGVSPVNNSDQGQGSVYSQTV